MHGILKDVEPESSMELSHCQVMSLLDRFWVLWINEGKETHRNKVRQEHCSTNGKRGEDLQPRSCRVRLPNPIGNAS